MPKTRPCPRCATQVPADAQFCQGCGGRLDAGPPKRALPQWIFLTAGAVAILVIVAGAIAFLGNRTAAKPPVVTVQGTEIVGAGPAPTWMKTADPSIVAEYAWAAEHYDELRYIPCYCGCNSVGHTGNASCYFRWDEKGKILGYDAHALG